MAEILANGEGEVIGEDGEAYTVTIETDATSGKTKTVIKDSTGKTVNNEPKAKENTQPKEETPTPTTAPTTSEPKISSVNKEETTATEETNEYGDKPGDSAWCDGWSGHYHVADGKSHEGEDGFGYWEEACDYMQPIYGDPDDWCHITGYKEVHRDRRWVQTARQCKYCGMIA